YSLLSTPVDAPVEKQLAPEAADDLWQAVTRLLRAQLGDATYRTWLAGVQALDLHNGVLRLSVPHQVARRRIETAYAEAIGAALRQVTDTPIDIELLVETAPRDVLDDEPGPDPLSFLSGQSAPPPPAVAAPVDAGRGRSAEAALNANYTFEQFVIGASNRFAHAAAMSVAEKPAAAYNPLFIYGESGLGKTHLLHAVGPHLLQLFPTKRVRYVTTESFMNEFVEAIRTNSRPDFKRRYREVDLLLMDDVQFVQNHERLQEEFFHTFDSLHGGGSQLVLSSDRPPKDMATLEDRLRTRFEWGLLTDIQPPEYETRLAILRHKARA